MTGKIKARCFTYLMKKKKEKRQHGTNGLVFTYIFEESIQPKRSPATFLLLTNQERLTARPSRLTRQFASLV